MSVRTTVKSIQDIMRQDSGVDGDAQRISQLCWMFFLKILDDQDQELELFDSTYRAPDFRTAALADVGSRPGGNHRRRAARLHQQRPLPDAQGTRSGRDSVTPPARRTERLRGRIQLHEIRATATPGRQQDQRGRLQQPRRASALRRRLRADPQRPPKRRQRGRVLHATCGHDVHDRAYRSEAGRGHPRPGVRDGRIPHLCTDPHADNYVRAPAGRGAVQPSLRAVEKKPLPHMLCTTNMLLHGIEDPSFVRHDNTLAKPYISYTQADRVDVVLTNPPFGGKEEPGSNRTSPSNSRRGKQPTSSWR